MNARSLLRFANGLGLLVVGSRAANAACVISVVRPTVPLPTMAVGQQFSFVATPDCETLRFRVPGTTFVKVPKPPDAGPRDRTYKVVLTESEWDSLVDNGDTRFTWSIIGTTSAGVTTRMTTTNALKVVKPDVTIDLSTADAKFVGEEAGDYAGRVAGAGDVDGDGHDDLLIGAPGNDEGGTTPRGYASAGAAYLVLGPVTGTLDLSLADAKLVGEGNVDGAGRVAGAGDVDGDGLDDLLVGAPGHEKGGSGAAYVVLGPVTGTLDLSLADTTLLGVRGEQFAGSVVSGAGDVDNDGRDDVLVFPQYLSEGHGYLVLAPAAGSFHLSRADAKFVGEEAGDLLLEGSGAGDVDADGHDDLVLGAFSNDEGGETAGAAYLVLGPVTGTLDLSLADAKLVGENSLDYVGHDVSGAGDVDADGHDDLLIGSFGAAYLVSGPVTGTLDLSLADAKFIGGGGSVSGAGDVDGDGHDDLLMQAPDGDRLVLGPVSGTLDRPFADAKLVGEPEGCCFLAGAGDVDADGRADILIGSGVNDEGGTDAGAAFLIYGGGL